MKKKFENLNPIELDDATYYVNPQGNPIFFFNTEEKTGYPKQDIYDELYLDYNYNADKTCNTISEWVKELYGIEIEFYNLEEDGDVFDWNVVIRKSSNSFTLEEAIKKLSLNDIVSIVSNFSDSYIHSDDIKKKILILVNNKY